MKIIATDISGTVFRYDMALYKAIAEEMSSDGEIVYECPYGRLDNSIVFSKVRLVSLVPSKLSHSESRIKRMTKAFEVVLNYIILVLQTFWIKPDILHLQWLPFIEFVGIESLFLRTVKKLSPKTGIILTVHNIFPHNMKDESKKRTYIKRFNKVGKCIDRYIVHNVSSKNDLCKYYSIDDDKISVVHHGIFTPEFLPSKSTRVEKTKLRILMYGIQAEYKGTDLLIESIASLDDRYKSCVDIRIIGSSSSELYTKYKGLCINNGIYWKNAFIEEEEMCQEITDADILIFPYRHISQSGALLLGLYYNKPMILSDVPSFRETMIEYPEEWFFRSNDINSLTEIIKRCVDGKQDYAKAQKAISNLNDNYSWKRAAQLTLGVYRKIINDRK